jgi:hypothetical protein
MGILFSFVNGAHCMPISPAPGGEPRKAPAVMAKKCRSGFPNRRRNARSPAATASLPIGRELAELAIKKFEI